MPKVKMTPTRHVPNDAGRRPIRPIDREKMRSWLERQLDMENVPDVKWVDRNRTMFEIPWRHAARHGWTIERDACIFELWAMHTKKFIPGKDKVKDPKRWKANFRCALNSLPDVERVPGHLTKGSQAVRRYRFLTPEEGKRRSVKAARSRKRRSRNDSDSTEEEEEEDGETTIEVKSESEDDSAPENNLPCGLSTASIPNFDQLLTDSDATPRRETRSTSHMSGGSLFQLREIPPPPSPQARSVSPHSLEGSSDSEGSHYSDEEVVEMVNSWQLETCHPKLWSDMTDLTDSIGCEVECVTEEVRCVIRFDPPEYWDLSSPME